MTCREEKWDEVERIHVQEKADFLQSMRYLSHGTRLALPVGPDWENHGADAGETRQ